MDPFSPIAILQEKHAQHVVLIHFPIALFLTGVFLDLTAKWSRRTHLATAAGINFLLAALASVPTVITGFVAWWWALEAQKLKGVLLYHLLFGLTSAVLIWTVWLIRRRISTPKDDLPAYLLSLEVAGVIVISITGHLGGVLSGINV